MRYSSFILLAALFMVGCENQKPQPTPSSNPLVRSLEEQMKAQQDGDSTHHRFQVRQAAIEHVKTHYPEWRVEGVSIYSNGGNDYTVGVDSVSNEGRQTVYTTVELFVKDSGEKYWKTRYLPSKVGAKPLEFTIKAYQ